MKALLKKVTIKSLYLAVLSRLFIITVIAGNGLDAAPDVSETAAQLPAVPYEMAAWTAETSLKVQGFDELKENIYGPKLQHDWLCVYPDRKAYFEATDNAEVFCIRIDSARNDGTILYPFSDLHQIGENCFSVTSGSWLSKYIILDEEGNTVFVNGKEQSILIKSQAALNENWDIFENESIKVKGEITSIVEKSVLGISDSVKTIVLSVYNIDNEPIDHSLNELTIEVSKNYGLIKTVNFYYFEHSADGYFHQFRELELTGIKELQLGFQNINLREQYYDFQVGDELHIWDCTDYLFAYLSDNKIIKRYVSRIDYADSIVYNYERKIHSTTKNFIDGELFTEVSTSQDTIKETILKGLLFETEPNEPYDTDFLYKVKIYNGSIPLMYLENTHFHYNDNEPCLDEIIWDGGEGPVYRSGLGGPYYSFWGLESFNCYELVYYKKGDTEFGKPFNFEVSIDSKKNNTLTVYPNPANTYISIKGDNNEILDNAIIEFYDMHGRKHLSKQLYNSDFIDVSFLNPGYYMVKLIKKDLNINYFKIVKQ